MRFFPFVFRRQLPYGPAHCESPGSCRRLSTDPRADVTAKRLYRPPLALPKRRRPHRSRKPYPSTSSCPSRIRSSPHGGVEKIHRPHRRSAPTRKAAPIRALILNRSQPTSPARCQSRLGVWQRVRGCGFGNPGIFSGLIPACPVRGGRDRHSPPRGCWRCGVGS